MGRSKRERKQKALGSLRSKHRRFSSLYESSEINAARDHEEAQGGATEAHADPEACDVAVEE